MRRLTNNKSSSKNQHGIIATTTFSNKAVRNGGIIISRATISLVLTALIAFLCGMFVAIHLQNLVGQQQQPLLQPSSSINHQQQVPPPAAEQLQSIVALQQQQQQQQKYPNDYTSHRQEEDKEQNSKNNTPSPDPSPKNTTNKNNNNETTFLPASSSIDTTQVDDNLLLEKYSDGLFNGIPIRYQEQPLYSTLNCIGENFQEDAWMFRSCQYRNLCLDVTSQEFVLFPSPQQQRMEQLVDDYQNQTTNASNTRNNKQSLLNTWIHLSTTATNGHVALGGINPKWKGSVNKLKWRPKISTRPLEGGYYQLPPHIVWVPYHSFAGYNAGHLLWDDFMSIYKLLALFGYTQQQEEKQQYQLLLSMFELKLWGTCDWNPKKRSDCLEMFDKFLPAMGLSMEKGFSTVKNTTSRLLLHGGMPLKYDESSLENMTLTNTSSLDNSTNTTKMPVYVCSSHAVAGIGLLTDHGFKLHGWNLDDYKTTHNVGRGQVFFEFRNFVVRNLGLDQDEKQSSKKINIIFSKFSSKTKGRVKGFGRQISILQQYFRGRLKKSDDHDDEEQFLLKYKNNVSIESHRMSRLSLRQQVEIALTSNIFVTCVGGGAMTATFLPRGSSLILFYEATSGMKRNRQVNEPARLDWDVLNHASHLRVHWLPVETLDEEADLNVFIELVRHELKQQLKLKQKE